MLFGGLIVGTALFGIEINVFFFIAWFVGLRCQAMPKLFIGSRDII